MAIARTYYKSDIWSSRGTAAQRAAGIMVHGGAPDGRHLLVIREHYRADGAYVLTVRHTKKTVSSVTGLPLYVCGHENICQHVRQTLRGWSGVGVVERTKTRRRRTDNLPITETHTLVLISPDAQPGIYTPQRTFKYCLKRIQDWAKGEFARLAKLRQLLELAGLADAPQGIQADYLEERGLEKEAAQHRAAF